MTRLGYKIIIVFLLTTLLLLPGCSSKNKESQDKKPLNSSSQKTKAPTEMKSILTDLEKIIAGLEQKIKAASKSGLMQSTQMAGEQGQQSTKEQSQQKPKWAVSTIPAKSTRTVSVIAARKADSISIYDKKFRIRLAK